MLEFTVERSIAASPEMVFEVLTDHRAYPDYTIFRKVTLEKEGVPAPNGVGAVRALSLAGPPAREEVLAYEAPQLFRYTVLSGLPVRDHVGTVELSPEGDGTRLSWHVQLTPTLGPLSPLFGVVAKRAIGGLISGIAKEAERRKIG